MKRISGEELNALPPDGGPLYHREEEDGASALQGHLLVLAQVDRQRSSAQSWTDFVQKISHHVVFFRTYRIIHCLKRGQSTTRK